MRERTSRTDCPGRIWSMARGIMLCDYTHGLYSWTIRMDYTQGLYSDYTQGLYSDYTHGLYSDYTQGSYSGTIILSVVLRDFANVLINLVLHIKHFSGIHI